VRRMRQIARELSRRARMTLLTGRDDILSAQMRLRVGNRQDIVRAVTVITFCRLCIPELGHFAMVGVEIRFCDRLMAAATLLHDLQLETGLISSTNRVSGVTIVAHRQRFVGLTNQRCVYAPLELFFDAVMTAPARLGNVILIDTGERIGLWQNAVRRMTTRAGGGHRQSALHQSFAVNALRVVLDDFMLGTLVPGRGFLAFPVAARTQGGDVRCECRRLRTQLPLNAVRPVTLFAGRSVRIVLTDKFPVDARLILLSDLRMTRRTINFLRDRLARPQMRHTDFRMTLTARHLLMSREPELLVFHGQ